MRRSVLGARYEAPGMRHPARGPGYEAKVTRPNRPGQDGGDDAAGITAKAYCPESLQNLLNDRYNVKKTEGRD